jgi:hypothetical protein
VARQAAADIILLTGFSEFNFEGAGSFVARVESNAIGTSAW